MTDLLRALLDDARPTPAGSVREWWARHRAAVAGLPPMEQALRGGLSADRAGYAFAAGYQAALRALVPSLPRDELASLCATEEGGAHPRAIRTALRREEDGYRLDGRKLFATLGTDAGVLLVVASAGEGDGGRNRLAVAAVTAGAVGVSRTPIPETPFIPEIPHSEIVLDAVRIAPEAVLPGDGYARYLKPFRTIEDLHVIAAVLAYVLGEANRARWPAPVRERLLFLISGFRALAGELPDDPGLHVALGGALESARRLLEETEALWDSVAPEARERWRRDVALLKVAGKARAQRLEKAWQRVAGTLGEDAT